MEDIYLLKQKKTPHHTMKKVSTETFFFCFSFPPVLFSSYLSMLLFFATYYKCGKRLALISLLYQVCTNSSIMFIVSKSVTMTFVLHNSNTNWHCTALPYDFRSVSGGKHVIALHKMLYFYSNNSILVFFHQCILNVCVFIKIHMHVLY